LRVYASTARSRRQSVRPNLLAQALIEYDDLQVSLAFDGDTRFGSEARHYVAGSEGSISSSGPDNRHQRLVLTTAAGQHEPELVGQWFDDGFHGAMGELLCSIEENRVPTINAADNLNSLALCFAAITSAQRHEPVVPGSVRRLP
jgi:predicted dehydrogenase